MTTPSPRLGLILLTDSDVVDVNEINTNSSTMDTIVSAENCTSTTHPANPYLGQWIYETDTQTIRRWSGFVWAAMAGNGNARGLVASGNNQSLVSLNSPWAAPSTIVMNSWSFTARNNNRYKVIEQGYYWVTSGGFGGTSALCLDFFSQMRIGSAPDSSGNYTAHYHRGEISVGSGSYRQTRIPYRKTYYFPVTGQSTPTVTCYLNSCIRAVSPGPSGAGNLQAPADSLGNHLWWVYEMGGSNQ